ncbi:hypothetical protein WME75_01080 [Sorangium sp. So ce1014]|uniref:hypothetical protein n=1 Tax=Sorangium sp. So ce1014 TaxID=3133326 RepID=UPI003F610C38
MRSSGRSSAFALQERSHPDRSDLGLRLRLSLNRGSCLAVNLNKGSDYFGRTVNLAAKLRGFAGAGQIPFPASFRDDPRARQALEGGASLSPAAPPQRFGCGVRRRYGRTAL